MSTNDIHGIESGWKVRTADGEAVGSVEEATPRYIDVRSGLLNPTHRFLPASTLTHVRPEMGEIGISLTVDELELGDWSQPPLEPPRVTGGIGANHQADGTEADPIAAGVVRDPERPIDRNPQA